MWGVAVQVEATAPVVAELGSDEEAEGKPSDEDAAAVAAVARCAEVGNGGDDGDDAEVGGDDDAGEAAQGAAADAGDAAGDDGGGATADRSGHRCRPHPQRDTAYRFLADSTNAAVSCGPDDEPANCGTVCSMHCLPGYTPDDTGGAQQPAVERLVCDDDGVWQRLYPLDDRGSHRGQWRCELLPPPTPTFLAIAPGNGSLEVKVICADAFDIDGTNYTVSATPSQCTADGYCFGSAATERFDGITGCTTELGSTDKVTKLKVTGLTNEAGYSLSVKAKNGGGEATARARTKASPTALVDEYATAEADYNARRSAYEDKRDEVERMSERLTDAQRGLDGCLEMTQGKYVYRCCYFKKCEQKDEGGYSWTSLGTWSAEDENAAEEEEAEGEDADADDAKEGRGLKVMRFAGGARCWNGPLRSANVILQCGAYGEMLSVSEPETCSYEIVATTPAACSEADIPPMFGAEEKKEL